MRIHKESKRFKLFLRKLEVVYWSCCGLWTGTLQSHQLLNLFGSCVVWCVSFAARNWCVAPRLPLWPMLCCSPSKRALSASICSSVCLFSLLGLRRVCRTFFFSCFLCLLPTVPLTILSVFISISWRLVRVFFLCLLLLYFTILF